MPDRHPRPRLRVSRFSSWLTVPMALWVLPVVFDEGREVVGLGRGVLLLSAVVGTLAFALLGKRALLGWRLVAASSALWLTPGFSAEYGPFEWPTALTITLVCAFLLTTFRYERQVAWGVWGWTAILLVLGGGLFIGLFWSSFLLAVTVVVDAVRLRRRAQLEAVVERELRARQEEHSLVLEERARIARDLHDVVAHHMSMIAVQAESARYRLPDLPEGALAELDSIAGSARAALADVRGILTVLRDGSAAAARAPQPTLSGLEELVENARQAGATVSLEVSGARRPLLAAVEIGAYRIVQESLANAARHAPGAAVVVHLAYLDRHVEVTVTNEAPPRAGGPRSKVLPADDGEGGATAPPPLELPRASEGGHGLVGMRERAALLGGEVAAGPTDEGGFRVHARLPLEVPQ